MIKNNIHKVFSNDVRFYSSSLYNMETYKNIFNKHDEVNQQNTDNSEDRSKF